MAIELKEATLALAESLIADGYFASTDEAIPQGLTALSSTIRLSRFDDLVQDGLRQADVGKFVELGEHWLGDRIELMKTRLVKGEQASNSV
ncbi:MAG TPA: hypothetical protein PK819_05685 [Thermomicrobiales bacterium]|nr:hypothetical protein [Thermomicrobiales bacterium]